jgi:hypothetical protein
MLEIFLAVQLFPVPERVTHKLSGTEGFTAFTAPAAEGLAAAGSLHPGAETDMFFSALSIRLECAFYHLNLLYL